MRKVSGGLISLVVMLATLAVGPPAQAGHLEATAAVDADLAAVGEVIMYTFTATNTSSSNINEINSEFHVPAGTLHVAPPPDADCPEDDPNTLDDETFTDFCTSPGNGANLTHSKPGDDTHDGTVVRGSSDPDEPLLEPGESLIYRVFLLIDSVAVGSEVCNEHHATARSDTLLHLSDDSNVVCTKIVNKVELSVEVTSTVNVSNPNQKQGTVGVRISSDQIDAAQLELSKFRFGSCPNPEARDTTLTHTGDGHPQEDGSIVGHWDAVETGLHLGDTEACLDLQPQHVTDTYYFGKDSDIKTN